MSKTRAMSKTCAVDGLTFCAADHEEPKNHFHQGTKALHLKKTSCVLVFSIISMRAKPDAGKFIA
jgi:hypothetical protein